MILEEQLEQAKVRYVSDSVPGITRKRAGKFFYYINPDGSKITDPKVIARIKSLAIPPAWENVWICTKANGHIQATGVDAKQRKQYRYHPNFIEVAQQNKFDKVLDFAESLPIIREQLNVDMSRHGMPQEKVLATIVWLLENTLIRIGNKQYEVQNKSYGLTTLKNRHVDANTNSVTFSFKGKSGVYHTVRVQNRRVTRVIRSCQEIPGQELFQYIDEVGRHQAVCSDDVNDYIHHITGKDITAKDFRTWGGTNIAAKTLDALGLAQDEKDIKRNLVETVKTVSTNLRNTPATCRKYYIHPTIFSAYDHGYTLSTIRQHHKYEAVKKISSLEPEEHDVVAMLCLF